jgi:2-polyprenyl-3-methyl-5-hydroxy-6-metoxy-1,4-benzoquinol methylase
MTIFFPLLEELPGCPVCSRPELRALDVYGIGKPIAVDALRLALVGCEACGIVFSHPLPTEEALARYYASENESWDRRVSERLERKARHRSHRDEGRSPTSRPDAGKKPKLTKRARHREELAAISALLPRGGDRRALDYGCGIGVFLDVLAESGWQTYGLEPGPTARAYSAERHQLVDAIAPGLDVDLAIVYHVLEHLRDPLAVLRSIGAAVRPGSGCIFVAVPDLGRLPEHRDRPYVASKLHLFSFTRSSLRSLLGLAGFEVVGFPEPRGAKTTRLLCLARRVDAAPPPGDRPLAEALAALRGYGELCASELRTGSSDPRS